MDTATGRWMAVVVTLTAVACGTPEAEPPVVSQSAAPAAAASTPPAAQELPDTTADAVWAYLQEQDYQSWPLWPGTTERYTGNEPHGMLLTTYVNSIALRRLEQGSASGMPHGAIIVKDNYMPDGSFAAATVMYKRDGYNPEHQDWWWLKRNADGSVDAAGKGVMCEQCHQAAAGADYLYTEIDGADAL